MPHKIFLGALNSINFFLFASFSLLTAAWLAIKLNLANELNASLSLFSYLDIIRSHLSLDLAICILLGLNFFQSRKSKLNFLSFTQSCAAFLFYLLIVFYFLKLTGLYAYTHDATPYAMIEYGTYMLNLPFAGKTLAFTGFIFIPTLLFLSLLVLMFLRRKTLEQAEKKYYAIPYYFISILIFTAFIPPIQKTFPLSLAYHPYIYSAFASFNNSPKENFKNTDVGYSAPEIIKEYDNRNKKNIVIVVLESFGASTIQKDITPNLYQLKENSFSFENTYSAIPHTSKALVTVHCGITPNLSPYLLESILGTPNDCLASQLSKQNYQSVFFQSVTQHFENRQSLVKQLGFTEFLPLEAMDKSTYESVNYFGYEDDIMLPKSKEWLTAREIQKPFIATYLTGTTHHNYHTPSNYSIRDLHEKSNTNRYLNAASYVDRFVGKLLQQYKDLGLYENTLFVFVGDHGEGFGDHRPLMHNNNLYESGIKIPLILHEGSQTQAPLQITDVTSQGEIFQLITKILNKKPIGQTVKMKTITSSCWYSDYCYSLLLQKDELIYKFILDKANNKRELYELTSDPYEAYNLVEKKHEFSADLEQQLLLSINSKKDLYSNYYSAKDKNYLASKENSFSPFIAVFHEK